MKRILSRFAGAPLLLALACGGETPPPGAPHAGSAAAPPTASADALGARPPLGDPAPYAPPTPTVYTRDNGLTVWLLERHSLPIVSMQIVVRSGAADDPEGKAGVAYQTANMLDEGAGKRGALDLSREIDRLGASIRTGAFADYSFAQLTVLKKNLGPAAGLLGDVVVRPQLAPVEWKRIHDLWENGLKARQTEPDAVAAVVIAKRAYPAGSAYAHPVDGLLSSAPKVALDDVKKFYGEHYKPENATCVVVGDIARAELDTVLDQAFAGWSQGGARTMKPKPQATEAAAPAPAGRKIVIVDRADAPQSVIAVARRGVAASDDASAALTRVNGALGGSFTSRLNQDLREEHGWSYGAHSRFSFNRNRGLFVAQAAVVTEHTGEALKAMLSDIDSLAKSGLTDDEVEKTKQLARGDLVQAFETVSSAAMRLGRDAGVGQAAEREAVLAKAMAAATKSDLAKLAATYIDAKDAVVVIVGPRAQIEPQLKSAGIEGTIEAAGPEGQ